MSTVFGESWQRFQNERMPGSSALAQTRFGRRDPWLFVVTFVPAVIPLIIALTELGSAERKKALYAGPPVDRMAVCRKR